MSDIITIGTEIDTLKIDGQKWIRKEAADRIKNEALGEAYKEIIARSEKFENILQPIRNVMKRNKFVLDFYAGKHEDHKQEVVCIERIDFVQACEEALKRVDE